MKIKYEITEEEKGTIIHLLKLVKREHQRDYICGRDTLLYTGSLNLTLKIFDLEGLDEESLKKQRSNDGLLGLNEEVKEDV